jgi:hypothetical protein
VWAPLKEGASINKSLGLPSTVSTAVPASKTVNETRLANQVLAPSKEGASIDKSLGLPSTLSTVVPASKTVNES